MLNWKNITVVQIVRFTAGIGIILAVKDFILEQYLRGIYSLTLGCAYLIINFLYPSEKGIRIMVLIARFYFVIAICNFIYFTFVLHFLV
jgi:hypothetical protein